MRGPKWGWDKFVHKICRTRFVSFCQKPLEKIFSKKRRKKMRANFALGALAAVVAGLLFAVVRLGGGGPAGHGGVSGGVSGSVSAGVSGNVDTLADAAVVVTPGGGSGHVKSDPDAPIGMCV
jgi:hypothetical protein